MKEVVMLFILPWNLDVIFCEVEFIAVELFEPLRVV